MVFITQGCNSGMCNRNSTKCKNSKTVALNSKWSLHYTTLYSLITIKGFE